MNHHFCIWPMASGENKKALTFIFIKLVLLILLIHLDSIQMEKGYKSLTVDSEVDIPAIKYMKSLYGINFFKEGKNFVFDLNQTMIYLFN